MITIRIVKNKTKIEEDSEVVVKVVIIDERNRVLMLTRSKNHKKYPGELDLPGGHVKKNENLNKGLRREVQEETGLALSNAIPFKQSKNKHFYYAKYDSQPIMLSDEHTDYKFYSKEELDSNDKFQKTAIEALEIMENDECTHQG